MNTTSDTTQETDPYLFVDDLSVIGAAPKPRKLVNSINSDFKHIYEWSLQNHMVFDSCKFKILNIGPKRLSKQNKELITYGDQPVRWERSAKLLGATFDIQYT